MVENAPSEEPSFPFKMIEGKGDPFETIPMILTCPICTERHIDEGEFEKKPHRVHACQNCGFVWQPAKVNTHGVRFLPGYSNEERKHTIRFAR